MNHIKASRHITKFTNRKKKLCLFFNYSNKCRIFLFLIVSLNKNFLYSNFASNITNKKKVNQHQCKAQ